MEIEVKVKNDESNSIAEILGLKEDTINKFIRETVLSDAKGLVQSIIDTLDKYNPDEAGAILVSMTAYKINDIMAKFEKSVKEK